MRIIVPPFLFGVGAALAGCSSQGPGAEASSSSAIGTEGGCASRLESGNDLAVGQSLCSPNGKYRAILQQNDGNFVVYDTTTNPKTPNWAAYTTGGVRVAMQEDCNVVVYDAAGVALWNSTTSVPTWKGEYRIRKCHLRMQDDGNLVAYQEFWLGAQEVLDTRYAWSSQTGRAPVWHDNIPCALYTTTTGYDKNRHKIEGRWDVVDCASPDDPTETCRGRLSATGSLTFGAHYKISYPDSGEFAGAFDKGAWFGIEGAIPAEELPSRVQEYAVAYCSNDFDAAVLGQRAAKKYIDERTWFSSAPCADVDGFSVISSNSADQCDKSAGSGLSEAKRNVFVNACNVTVDFWCRNGRKAL